MNQTKVQEKILNLESELECLKRLLVDKPDFDIDEKNWQKIKSQAKKSEEKFIGNFMDKNKVF